MSNYYRNISAMKTAQANYDHMLPPDYWVDEDDDIQCSPADCESCNLATLYGKCTIGKEPKEDNDESDS